MTTTALQRTLAIVCLAVAAPVIAGACAGADPEPTASALVLTVSKGESVDPTADQITLNCDPDGGDHRDPSGACAALRTAGGDVGNLTGDPGACFQIYDPVTAAVTGTWMGQPVTWQKTFGNSCELARATTPIF